MSDVQKYRITFKCACGYTFKKLTKNANLTSAPCPECKSKEQKSKLFKIGDGAVPSTETVADPFKDKKPKVFPNTVYKCRDCLSILKVYEEVGETALTECYACGSGDIHFRGKIAKDVCGDNAIKNKCVDKTADIVMQDYGMTDLKDNVRAGESMAPKLAPHLQQSADNFFGGVRGKNSALPRNAAAMAKKALAGAYRDTNYVDPVKRLHDSERRGIH